MLSFNPRHNKRITIFIFTLLISFLSILFLSKTARTSPPLLRDEITFNLTIGWNLVSFPFAPETDSGEIMKADDLCSLINAQNGDCEMIIPFTNGWTEVYDPLFPVKNFDLEAGCGYAIRCNAEASIVLTGAFCKSKVFHFLKDRFYFIGPTAFGLYTAEELSNGLGTIREIIKDRQTIFDPLFPINNFELERGNAYFIRCSEDTSWWCVDCSGQPLYNDPDNKGVYIWQTPDRKWHIHFDEGAIVSSNDSINNIPIDSTTENQARTETGYTFETAQPVVSFDLNNIPPENIYVGLWGASPDSSSFQVINHTFEKNIITLDLSNPSPIIGETFSADINIHNATDVYGAPFHLKFDSYAIEIQSVEKGDFFSEPDVDFLDSINNEKGELIIGLNRTGDTSGNNGDGTLVKITFKAISAGESLLYFKEMELRDSSKSILPGQWIGSRINIGYPPPESLKIIGIRDDQASHSDPNGNVPDGIIFSNPNIMIEGTTGKYSQSVIVNGVPVTPINGYFVSEIELNTLNCKDNYCENRINIIDQDTNTYSEFIVYYGVMGGEFTIISPCQGEITNKQIINVRGTIENIDYTVIIKGEDPNQSVTALVYNNGEFEAQGIKLNEGENRLIATQIDLLGNEISKEVTVIRDTNPPRIIIKNPNISSEINLDTSSSFAQTNMVKLFDKGNGIITLAQEDERVWKSAWEGASINFPINAIAINPITQEIWFGTQNNGLYSFDLMETWNRFDSQKGLISDTINDLCFDDSGKLWIGTSYGIGMFDGKEWYRYSKMDDTRIEYARWDKNMGEFIRVELYEDLSGGHALLSENISDILINKKEKVWEYWFATEKGISIFDGSSWKVLDPNIEDLKITSLSQDEDNKIWIGTEDHGLYLYEENSGGSYTRLEYIDLENHPITITAILPVSDDILWIGTDQGLIQYDHTASTHMLFNQEEGFLDSNHITALEISQNGDLWVGTENGISIYDGEEWVILRADTEENLLSDQVRSLKIDKKGNVWLGTNQGLSEYYQPYFDSGHLSFSTKANNLTSWDSIQWAGIIPSVDSTSINIKIRSASTEESLQNAMWHDFGFPASPQLLRNKLTGAWIEIQVYFDTVNNRLSPELDYLMIGYFQKTYMNYEPITISGIIEDDTFTRIYVSGIEAAVEENKFTRSGISLNWGENRIKIHAIDSAGNKKEEEVVIVLDKGIDVTIEDPRDGSTLLTPFIPVYVTVTQAGQVRDSGIDVLINEKRASWNGSNYIVDLHLHKGDNKIIVEAIDLTSNQRSSKEINVQVLDDHPSIHVTSHKDGDIVNTSPITITGEIDLIAQKLNLSIYVSGIKATIDENGQFVAEGIELEEGKNAISVIARDEDTGQESEISIGLVLDTIPPKIEIIDPASNEDYLEQWDSFNIDGEITCISEDHNGNIWVGTADKGIFRIGAQEEILNMDCNQTGLCSNPIYAIAEDLEGNIWFGTNRGIVSKLDMQGSWKAFHISDIESPGNKIKAIAADKTGGLWFGTESNGIFMIEGPHVIDDPNAQITHYTTIDGLGDNNISSLAIDGENNIWAGTFNGVSILEKENGYWYTYKSSNSGLTSNRVYSARVDDSGNIWFGTEWGLSRFDVSRECTSYLSKVAFIQSREKYRLQAATFNSSGGISEIDTNDGTLEFISSMGEMGSEAEIEDEYYIIQSGFIPAILETEMDLIINGEEDGLCGESLYDLVFDAKGDLWILTNKGISRLKPNGEWITYNATNSGLDLGRLNSLFIDRSGNKWFGSRSLRKLFMLSEVLGVNTSPINIYGTVEDYSPTIIKVDNIPAIQNNTGSFMVEDISLQEGENTLTLVATDQAGNVTSLDIPIFYKPQSQYIRIEDLTGPTGYIDYSHVDFNWSGWANIEDSNSLVYKYILDGQVISTGWKTDKSGQFDLEDGFHKFSVMTKDGAYGLESAATSKGFVIDTTKPVLWIKEIPISQDLKAVRFEWGATDNICIDANIQYQYKLDNEDWSGWSYETSIEYPDIEPGDHIFYVKARDLLNNQTEKQLVVDLKRPQVFITKKPEPIVNYNAIAFEFGGSDNLSPLNKISYSCRLAKEKKVWSGSGHVRLDWENQDNPLNTEYSFRLNNEEWTEWGWETSHIFKEPDPNDPNVQTGPYDYHLPEGGYSFILGSKDTTGKEKTSQIDFYVGETVYKEYDIEEIDIYPWSEWSYRLTKAYPGLQDGRYRFYVMAKDDLGYISHMEACEFTVDTCAPQIRILEPIPDSGNDIVDICALQTRVALAVKGEKPSLLTINGIEEKELGLWLRPENIPFDLIYDQDKVNLNKAGNTYITIMAKDNAGNVSEKKINLFVSSIQIDSPSEGERIKFSPITVTGKINISTISGCQVLVKGELNTLPARVYEDGYFEVDGIRIKEGNNEIQVILTDPNGLRVFIPINVTGENLSKGITLSLEKDRLDDSSTMVNFAANASFPANRYEWDFDGDGIYEIVDNKPGTQREQTFHYRNIRFYKPTVRVRETPQDGGHMYTDTITLDLHESIDIRGNYPIVDPYSSESVKIVDLAYHELENIIYLLDQGSNSLFTFLWGASGETPDRSISLDIICDNYNTAHCNNPSSLAIDQTGKIYITDTDNHRIIVLEKQLFEDQFIFYDEINKTGVIDKPFGITIDEYGHIWVSDSGTNKIYMIDSNHELKDKYSWGTYWINDIEYKFQGIKGVTKDSGYIYVVENGKKRILKLVQRQRKNSYELECRGIFGLGPEVELEDPIDIYHDSKDHFLYVTDKNGQKVVSFDPEGNYRFELSTKVGINLSAPSGVTFANVLGDKKILYISDIRSDKSHMLGFEGDLLHWGYNPMTSHYIKAMEKIVFERNGSIYTINNNGSNMERLPVKKDGIYIKRPKKHPSWSLDGGQIIFVLNNYEICAVNASGDDLRSVYIAECEPPSLCNIEYPSPSSDGSKLLFSSNESGNFEIYVLDMIEDQFRSFPACFTVEEWNNIESQYPGIENNLQSIITQESINNTDFYCIEVSQIDAEKRNHIGEDAFMDIMRHPFNVTKNNAWDITPSWSPHDDKIIFASNMDGDNEIYIIDIDGSQLRKKTNNNENDRQPRWIELSNPSQERIAYVEEGEIHYYNIDDKLIIKNENYILNCNCSGGYFNQCDDNCIYSNFILGGYNLSPSWMPNGKALFYTENGNIREKTLDKDITLLVNNQFGYNKDPFHSPDRIPSLTVTQDENDIIVKWGGSLDLNYKVYYGSGNYIDVRNSQMATIPDCTMGTAYEVYVKGYDQYDIEVLSSNTETIKLQSLWPKFTIEKNIDGNPYIIKIDGSSSVYNSSLSERVYFYWKISGVDDSQLGSDSSFFQEFPTSGEYTIMLSIKQGNDTSPYVSKKVSIEKDLEARISYKQEDRTFTFYALGDPSLDDPNSTSSGASQGHGLATDYFKWNISNPCDEDVPPFDNSPTIQYTLPPSEDECPLCITLTAYRKFKGAITQSNQTEKCFTNIEKDTLEAVINYEILKVATDPNVYYLFSAKNSIGSNISWKECKWEIFLSKTHKIIDSGISTLQGFKPSAESRIYPVTLTINRGSSNTESDTVTQLIRIDADELKANFDYIGKPGAPLTGDVTFSGTNVIGNGTKFLDELARGDYIRLIPDDSSSWRKIALVINDTNATLEDSYSDQAKSGKAEILTQKNKNTFIFNAALSEGAEIDWPNCEWYLRDKGQTFIYKGVSFSHTFEVSDITGWHPVTLNIYRNDEKDTVTKFINVARDHLEAVIDYKIEEDNTVIFDARRSIGQDIKWDHCAWDFGDDSSIDNAHPVVSHKYEYLSEEKRYPVTLTIFRKTESASVKKYITIDADLLNANFYHEKLSEDGSYIPFLFDAQKGSAGSNIAWDKCLWFFDDGQVLQGSSVKFSFFKDSTSYNHPVMLVIYRYNDLGIITDSASCFKYIKIEAESFTPRISIKKLSGTTYSFSARESSGSRIMWNECEWRFSDSPRTEYGSDVLHSFPVQKEATTYYVTLTIYRRNRHGEIESEKERKEININETLVADFSHEPLGNGKFKFDAMNSKGFNIDWSICNWNFGEDADEITVTWQNITNNVEGTTTTTDLYYERQVYDIEGVQKYVYVQKGSETEIPESKSKSDGGQKTSSNIGHGAVVFHTYKDPGTYPVTLTIYSVNPYTNTITGISSKTKNIIKH